MQVSAAIAQPATNLTRFAWLSIAAAVVTIALKVGAWSLTGSVGLLSDAAESGVNLLAAVVALFALRVAARPADLDHQFGHTKAEYFSAAVEGVMIFVAALFIIYSAVQRFITPVELENVGIGLVISVLASLVNAAVAVVLLRAGRAHRSITLVADGRHLLTDVWTSAGVLVGVLGVAVTGWLRLDPVVAILVGANIVVTGVKLLHESANGLMDRALGDEDVAQVQQVLDTFRSEDVAFHGLRTRAAGRHRFISVHVLVPGSWNVQQGHDLLEDIEAALRGQMDQLSVETHLEPLEDPRAYDDLHQ